MALTAEELNAQFNTQVKEALVNVVGSVKSYVDGKDEVLKTEISELVVKELTDIEGLGEQLSKIQEMADAFASVFDSDEDGAITPEEILAKAVLLQQAIDGVNGRVDAVEATIAEFKSVFDDEVAGLKSRLDATEVETSKNRDRIAEVEANLSTNYFTKDDVTLALEIKGQEILDAVNDVLFPSEEE